MRKISAILVSILVPVLLCGQVMETAETLKPGQITAGSYFCAANSLSLLVKGGYGWKNGVDLSLSLRAGSGMSLYLDVEKVLKSENKYVLSGTFGVHKGIDDSSVGVDGIANFTIPFKTDLAGYAGLHLALDYYSSDLYLPINLFAGAEYSLRKNLTALCELNLGFNHAPNILGLGLNYYF